MALLLDAVRRISAADRFVRAGRWPGAKFPMSRRISGRRLGIYGLGGIGGALAPRAAAFGIEVGYHNRGPRPDVPWRYFSDLGAMAEWCDYLIIACPLTPATLHSVDRPILEMLGPEGCLINIARGEIVDQQALIEVLENGALGSAGLDVFENEPEVPERLLALESVVLTPHIAVQTPETQADTRNLVISNVESFFATGRLLTPIDLSGV
jgi:lactate dehydrogenase-like 2-hydroxyacid dehydrogenase